MDRFFLDANVLFSAAYREDSGLERLWELPNVEKITSSCALEEARLNLQTEDRIAPLNHLIKAVEVLPEPIEQDLPLGVELAEKDRPILAAALAAGASHLITGDRRDFGRYFGKYIGKTVIMRPRDDLNFPRVLVPPPGPKRVVNDRSLRSSVILP